MSTSSETMRFPRLRALARRMHFETRGWSRRLAAHQAAAGGFEAELARFELGIRHRPELGADNDNRISNMERCAELVDGLVMRPGQVFSLQEAIGEPSEDRGFHYGPTLASSGLGRSVGGGICQVSTVLFNTALLGDLTICRSYNHSSDPWRENRLIELGRDAAFVFNRRDLVVGNPSLTPVRLGLELSERKDSLIGTLYSPAGAERPGVDLAIGSPRRRRDGRTEVRVTRTSVRKGTPRVTFSAVRVYRQGTA